MKIDFTLNNEVVTVDVSPLRRAIDVLRDDLGLTSVKEGCGEGECGTCSILMDGSLVNSCLIPILQLQGAEITTVEGIRDTESGRCIIEAFAEEGSVQCGFCTPGMLIAAEAILRKNPQPSAREVRKELSGNLCRCTGYDMIVSGVLAAARKGEGLW